MEMMGSDTEIDVANDNVDEAGSGLAKDTMTTGPHG